MSDFVTIEAFQQYEKHAKDVFDEIRSEIGRANIKVSQLGEDVASLKVKVDAMPDNVYFRIKDLIATENKGSFRWTIGTILVPAMIAFLTVLATINTPSLDSRSEKTTQTYGQGSAAQSR